MFRFHQFSAFMYSSILLRLLYTFLMVWTTLWQMVRTHSGKGVYDDVLESSTHHCGTIRSPVSPPSPPMRPVSLEQLLVPLNAIVQRLAAIDESGRTFVVSPAASRFLLPRLLTTHPPFVTEPPQEWGVHLPGSRSGDSQQSENTPNKHTKQIKPWLHWKLSYYTLV
jgi:hypothetical protein